MSDSSFIFQKPVADLTRGQASFPFRLYHNQELFQFTEYLYFPPPPQLSTPSELLKTVLAQISLILGLSYWKIFCPTRIEIDGATITKSQANFWNIIYTKGLGEFYYKNKIDFRDFVHFPFEPSAKDQSISAPRRNRALLFLGGGKDSIVAGELLKKSGKEFAAFTLHGQPLQREVAKIMGAEIINFERQIDPQLFELTKRPDARGGHIPISLAYAWTGLLAAILYDYRYLVVANEASANYGNIQYLGEEINHQWGKSFEFEQLLKNYIHKVVTPEVTYFSLLRPLMEIKIAEIFSRFPQYFTAFSSCNRNFTLDNDHRERQWCGRCPKCAFVFVSLAAFLAKAQVVKIFGRDLLARPSLLPTFEALLGFRAVKPFECVGTAEETKLAFALAHDRGGYEADLTMKMFLERLGNELNAIKASKEKLLGAAPDHLIPSEFQSLLANNY